MAGVEITWLGWSCFRLKGKEVIVLTDPYEGLRKVLEADIVTISHGHPGHNYPAAVKGEAKLLRGPGEYEIRGVFIYGLQAFHDGVRGRARGKNTIFLIELDGIKACHLGDLGHMLSAEQAGELSDTDVLLVPVGGGTTISPAEAAELVNLIDPKLVIPMHFHPGEEKSNLSLKAFLQEMGLKALTPIPKLAITKTSLPTETQVILLESGQ